MKIIDLSMPIEPGHIRWPVERGVKGNFAKGDLFEVSWVHTSCHGFTHMDAPRHMVPGGETLEALDLARVVGHAAVIDLSDILPNEEITEARIEKAAGHLAPGEIALFRTCWDEQRNWKTEAVLARGAVSFARGVRMAAGPRPDRMCLRLPAGLHDPVAAGWRGAPDPRACQP